MRNNHTIEQGRRYISGLHRLQSLCLSINKEKLKDALPMITKGMARLINAETAAACIIEGDNLEFLSAYGKQAKAISMHNINIKNSACAWILKNKRPVLIDNPLKNKRILKGFTDNIRIDSFIGVPLFSEKGILGIIFAFNKKNRDLFTKQDIDFLNVFSTVVSPLIENIRLNERQNQIQNELSALQSIIDTTLANKDLENLLYSLTQKVVRAMAADAGGIYLLDEANNIFFRTSYNVPEEVLKQYEERMKKEIVREVQKREGPFISYAKDKPILASEHIKSYQLMSMLAVPLRVKKMIIGILHIDTLVPHIFSPYEINLLEILSERIALAIENAQLFTALNEEVDVSTTLLQTSELISNHTTVNQLLKRIANIIPWLINSDWCCTYLWDEKEAVFIPDEISLTDDSLVSFFRGLVIKPGTVKIADKIFSARSPIVIEDVRNSGLFPQVYINTLNVKSALITPFVSKGDVMGFMNIAFAQAAHSFTTKEIAIAKGIANQVAVALENIRLNEEIKESEERYRALVENATDAITSIDLDGVVISWNSAAERLYGYSKEDVIGKKISIVPEDRTSELPMFFENVSKGKTISNFETKRRHKDGRLIDVSLTISPIKDEKREIIGFSGISRDITEKRQLEEKRIQLEKEAALVELAGAAAHEINQPLTSILARTDLLMTEMPKEEPLYRSIKVISDEAKRIASLVQQIGNISKYKTKSYIGKETTKDIEGAAKDDSK
ncbi:MAG: GAF domain-containing protein [Nitrospirae bacterium]|nr:GAF domain-containing protein [Nitrospirota bacterium]